jgi:hypothetical protein
MRLFSIFLVVLKNPMHWMFTWISRIIRRFRRKGIGGVIGVKDGLKDGFKFYIWCGHRKGKDKSGF